MDSPTSSKVSRALRGPVGVGGWQGPAAGRTREGGVAPAAEGYPAAGALLRKRLQQVGERGGLQLLEGNSNVEVAQIDVRCEGRQGGDGGKMSTEWNLKLSLFSRQGDNTNTTGDGSAPFPSGDSIVSARCGAASMSSSQKPCVLIG